MRFSVVVDVWWCLALVTLLWAVVLVAGMCISPPTGQRLTFRYKVVATVVLAIQALTAIHAMGWL